MSGVRLLLFATIVLAHRVAKLNGEKDDDGKLSEIFGKLKQVSQSQKKIRPSFNLRWKAKAYNAVIGVPGREDRHTSIIGSIFRVDSSTNDDYGTSDEDPKIRQNVSELIRQANPNFRTEVHNVPTKDGYILTIFRITNAVCGTRSAPPTFFQHGFLGSAADWLLLDPEYDFPFIMAKEGFDVWLGNSRGNQYSDKHMKYTSKNPKYWDFSFHEMGVYDLPAVFDYILNNTKKAELNYVGYELGTTMFYACLSSLPDKYNTKIRTMIGLGPTAYMSRSQSPLQFLKYFGLLYVGLVCDKTIYFCLQVELCIRVFSNAMTFNDNSSLTARTDGPLIPSTVSSFLRFIQPKLCDVYKHGRSFCSDALALIFGADQDDAIGEKVIPQIFGHMPQTTSIKTFIHFLQLLQSDQFREFDYGTAKNMLIYGQPVPPNYNLFLIQTRTVNFYGQRDLFLDEKDAGRTVDELGTAAFKYNVEMMEFDHSSLLFSEYFSIAHGFNILTYLLCKSFDQNGRCIVDRISTKATCSCPGECMTLDPDQSSYFSVPDLSNKSSLLQYIHH